MATAKELLEPQRSGRQGGMPSRAFEQLQVVPRPRPRAFGTGRERIGHSQASVGGDVVQQAQEPAHWPLKQVGRV